MSCFTLDPAIFLRPASQRAGDVTALTSVLVRENTAEKQRRHHVHFAALFI